MLSAVEGTKTEWIKRDGDAARISSISREHQLPPELATLVAGRGIEDIPAYLSPRLRDLPDPLRLAGAPEAVERVIYALDHGETVGIFGDYDVDGVTSTTLLWGFLEECGASVCATLPDRLTEGYGLSRSGVDRLAAAGAKLIITVDCGVTAHEEIAYCTERGIDVIVIDHHTVPVELPKAVAVINPHRKDCERGSEHLCAVGVTFNLCLAVRQNLRKRGNFFSSTRPEPDLRRGLDLVALGTVADVVPLRGENRIFVRYGVERMKRDTRAGIHALLDVAKVHRDKMSAQTLGFQLGPRINAAGRLGDAMYGVTLLRSIQKQAADELAHKLDSENLSRREIEKKILEEAIAEIDASSEHQNAKILVVGRDSWHPGVVGIVASRLVDRYGKPAVVIGDGGRGSGRSISRFHLHEGLSAVSETLAGFGGHAHAAGVRLVEGGLDRFRDALAQHAQDKLGQDDLTRRVIYDGEMSIHDVNFDLLRTLQKAAPFGRGNPEPVFRINNVTPRSMREMRGGHFKANIHPKGVVQALCFGAPERQADFDGPIDVVGTPEINVWNGNENLQVRVRDFRKSTPETSD